MIATQVDVMPEHLRAAFAVSQRGSPRATLIRLGKVGCLAYLYISAAFAYGVNQPFLVYTALFGATDAALIAGQSGLKAGRRDKAAPS